MRKRLTLEELKALPSSGKYSFDPGLDGHTGFFYPIEWNDYMDRWPSAEEFQASDAYEYVKGDINDTIQVWHPPYYTFERMHFMVRHNMTNETQQGFHTEAEAVEWIRATGDEESYTIVRILT